MASDVDERVVHLWCMSTEDLCHCTAEARGLLSDTAAYLAENRTRGPRLPYTKIDTGGVDRRNKQKERLNVLLTFPCGHTLFRPFLAACSFGIGGIRFDQAPILDPEKNPALTELARQVADVFRLKGLAPVMMQVIREETGYALPLHTDRPDWVCAVSITLGDGAAEWLFRRPKPEGDIKVIVSPGQCWAVSSYGKRVMPYNTPHAHAALSAPRLAVVVRFKEVPAATPWNFAAWWSRHGGTVPLTEDTIKFLKENNE
jgi:hypothetical protein